MLGMMCPTLQRILSEATVAAGVEARLGVGFEGLEQDG